MGTKPKRYFLNMSMPESRWDIAGIVVLILVGIVVLTTFPDYGVTWDEHVQHRYGVLSLRYFTSFGQDTTAFALDDLRYYGPLFEVLVSSLARISPGGLYETRHLVTAATGLIALIGTWQLGRLLGGPRAGFFALILIVLTPRFYGHMFTNPKDIPFAAGYIWSLYALALAIPAAPRIPWRQLAVISGIIGLTMVTRIGGLVLLFYLGVILGAATVRAWYSGSGLYSTSAAALLRLLAAVALAWIIMVAAWPWLHGSPVLRFIEAFNVAPAVPASFEVLFLGEVVPVSSAPLAYAPVWLGIALPVGTLILAAAGAGLGLRAIVRNPRLIVEDDVWRVALVLLAVVGPLAWILVSRVVLYDGLRHLLFIVPPLSVLAGVSGDHLLARLSRIPGALVLATVTATMYLGSIAVKMARLHPYEQIWFNAAAGGLRGADGRFETDYWGLCYKDAVEILTEHITERYGESPPRMRVASEGARISTQYFLPPFLKHTRDVDSASFYLTFTRSNIHLKAPGETVGIVKRLGVPLCYVQDLHANHR